MGGGAIVAQGSAGPPGSLLSVHAGCISNEKKGEWTPMKNFPCKDSKLCIETKYNTCTNKPCSGLFVDLLT